MNQGIKKRWVQALRSGEYEQGQGGLHSTDGKFCCLGVLCDLAAREGVVEPSPPRGGWIGYSGRTGLLPWPVSNWAGLTSADPVVREGSRHMLLSGLNDTGLYDFDEIADIIEAQPEDWT